MADRPDCSASDVVTIHLLDSALGHPLQSWRFSEKHSITIGRAEENDVVIADPHVSRIHAKIEWRQGEWTLVSVGRHGTLVDDRIVAEAQMAHQTRFRLGGNGPTLRFERGVTDRRPSETIDASHPDFGDFLDIDRQRQQEEADAISGDAVFQQLRDHIRRTRRGSDDDAVSTNRNQAVDLGGNRT